jgi:N-acetylmuramoyl-L-alanine amidase
LNTLSSQRGLRLGAFLLFCLLPTLPALARAHHGDAWARSHFAAAERMREALNGRLLADRSRHDYQRVINAYRSVYYGAPTSTKADPSVVAVAEILVEMGRRFDDDKVLNDAIGQYKFLRREYPGSKYRFDALFTIGEIYKDDFNNPDHARSAFKEFLHRYPANRLAENARQAIAEIDREIQPGNKPEADKAADKETPRKDDKESRNAQSIETASRPAAAKTALDEGTSRQIARVTGVRHWSTPDYTRVAIDVENEVKFASQRISHPDRIFFDLRGTKLASTLVGKSFDVDDGFLKKIRVAQYQPGRTRVVLEVHDLSGYEAFLLPNPYRLIIDIHGKNATAKVPKNIELPASDDSEATDTSGGNSSLKQEIKVEIKAEAGKAPVASMDVADDAKISPKESRAGSLSPAAALSRLAKPESLPVKKVVEADDEDNDSSSTPKSLVVAAIPDASANRSIHAPSRGMSGRKRGNLAAELDVREAQPTASGERSLIRALGLKIGRIVIDPGHGGHDTGTIGPHGLEEKDLVLEVGRRLGKMLETRLGAEVVYTRKDDTFVPLETRTAIANQERADLFISIHANSSRDPGARGVETYYLNFTSSPEALEVAARENAVSEKSIYELQDLVKKIALKEKIEESREFAGDVQQSLHSGLALKSPAIRNRGVKKAPFIVLIGANMPSILAEISFVSNPADEHRLETAEYRRRIAESLYRGIAKYVNGLSGVKVASKIDKAAGQ